MRHAIVVLAVFSACGVPDSDGKSQEPAPDAVERGDTSFCRQIEGEHECHDEPTDVTLTFTMDGEDCGIETWSQCELSEDDVTTCFDSLDVCETDGTDCHGFGNIRDLLSCVYPDCERFVHCVVDEDW